MNNQNTPPHAPPSRLSVSLPWNLLAVFKASAAMRGQSIQDATAEALKQWTAAQCAANGWKAPQ